MKNKSVPKDIVVLRLLAISSEMYGLQMVNVSCGGLRIGTIYVLLWRMKEDGLVTSRAEVRGDGNTCQTRQLYRISDAGRGHLLAHEANIRAAYDRINKP